MNLNLSPELMDAVEDADYLQGSFLTPLAAQLGSRTGNEPADAGLAQHMARTILGIMETFGCRSSIGIRTEMGFTTALAFLAADASSLPGFAPERQKTLDLLRASMATPKKHPLRQGLPVDSGLFALMGAILLAAARAMAPHGENEASLFGKDSVLSSRRAAAEFVLNMHKRMLIEDRMPGLPEKDRLKIRVILDIVEDSLPPREAPALKEILSPEMLEAIGQPQSSAAAETHPG